jgi:predicted MFS family arabinose efflux permease
MLARLPSSMAVLALQLAGLRATGSIATGATLAGVMILSGGVGGLFRGRSFDKREVRAQLQLSCLAAGVTMIVLTLAVAEDAPLTILFVLSAFVGLALSGVPSGFRALLVVVVPDALLHRAHFFESTMYEVAFVLGPLLASLLVVAVDVFAALGAMALVLLASAAMLGRLPRLHPHPETSGRRRLPHGLAILCLAPLPVDLAFGLVESNIPARMQPYGLPVSVAGIFLTCLSLGSCCGGIAVSLRPLRPRRSSYGAAAMLAIFAVLVIPGALAPNAAAFAVCLLFTSPMLVPLNGLGMVEIERRVGPDRRGTVFGVYLACAQIGGGMGAVVNGQLLRVVAPASVPLVASAVFALTSLAAFALGVRSRVVARRVQAAK